MGIVVVVAVCHQVTVKVVAAAPELLPSFTIVAPHLPRHPALTVVAVSIVKHLVARSTKVVGGPPRHQTAALFSLSRRSVAASV